MNISQTIHTLERSITVTHPMGLHARPAAIIAQAAQQFQSEILIITRDKKADAKSVLDILCLAIPCNTAVTISISGYDALAAMEKIRTIFEHPVD